MKLSLAITTYNRAEMTIKSFYRVINDERIDEIVIVDDCSDPYEYNRLFDLLILTYKKNSKIKFFRNNVNLGMLQNKKEAVRKCSNEWVILFDSDNILTTDYIHALQMEGDLKKDTIYCPDFAKPEFNFTNYSGLFYNSKKIKNYFHYRDFRPHLNCCNYVLNREEFLKSFVPNPDIKESDTIWIAYNWLKNGNNFKIVPNMHYFHTVGDHSGWLKNADLNMQHNDEIIEKIKQL